jgi:MiaB-like tRNA modifying enzyme
MRVFLKSYGCSANLADGEVLAGCLREAGFKLTDSASDANLLILNCCAVKGPTENRMIETLKRVPPEKKLVVAGCLPLICFERLRREVRFDGVVGPAAGRQIVGVVNRVCEGYRVVELEGSLGAKPDFCLPRLRSNPVVSVVPVSYGCLGTCAYCCVVFARGRLRSYSVGEVVDRVKKDLAAGAREFWITSQDVACYGRDIGVNLATLLRALGDLEGDFRVRVGMMTPNLVTDILDELIEAFRNDKVFKFLHLPVQSGDDAVLKRMRRFYGVEDFKHVVKVFRRVFPDVTLATDVICGFPGEDREAFEKTIAVVNDVKPDVVNISKFFARPGTAAAEMRDGLVEKAEIKRRTAEIARLAKTISLERNRRWNGWVGEVLVDEKGKKPGSWIGRNFAYKPVVVKSSKKLLGKTLNVEVVRAFQTHLEAEVVP